LTHYIITNVPVTVTLPDTVTGPAKTPDSIVCVSDIVAECVLTYVDAVMPADGALFAGYVQKTVLVPTPKSTLLSELEEEITVSLESVSVAASVTVPIPTSN
jgi:hypothetical protein